MATVYSEFLDVEPDEYRRATDVANHGTVWGTRSALKRMSLRNRGTIVRVGSAPAFRGIPLQAPYCGAKHACKGFTESVITEIKHHGARPQLPDDAHEAPSAGRLDRGRSRCRDRRRPCEEALGDRAEQLGRGRAEAVGMLFLEHGTEGAYLATTERRSS